MKSYAQEPAGNRREFFRAAARYGALGLVTAVSAALGRRGLRGQTCVNQGLCGGCSVFNTCGLPAASSARRGRANPGGAS